ncbi:MAG: hypothetical protein JWM63_2844 [Gammaproteobacteria bacterium]|jgi:hypothetical protein|nr:hypothetical protein [Gammaproteobacteria bacterium]
MGMQVDHHGSKRAWLLAAATLGAMMAAHAATSVMALSEAVLRNGPDSRLPAHLSVVLGVSRVEEPTRVKQAVIREAGTVRTFNVCAGNHDDVVLLTYDEQSRTTKAYLVSGRGVLRKAVDYQSGGAARERALIEARSDFRRELKFWTEFSGQWRPR